MLTHVKSVEAWMPTVGRLPVQLKFLIEGEEEVGSEGVEDFIAQEAARLACDVVVISDSSQFGPGQPAITYGLKGIAYFELRLTGPGRICIPARLAVRSPIRSTAAGPPDGQPGGRAGTDPGARLLRRCGAADASGNASSSPRCRLTKRRSWRQIGVNGVTGERGYTTSNGAGRVRPATSTASGAVTRAAGPRRCCPPRPA